MKKFEYQNLDLTKDTDPIEQLNLLGQKGWELVGVMSIVLYKRLDPALTGPTMNYGSNVDYIRYLLKREI